MVIYCIDPGIPNVFTPGYSDNLGRLMESSKVLSRLALS